MASKSVGLLNIVFGADLRGFERAMKKAQKNLKKFGSSMKRVGGNLTRSVTMPILAVGAASAKMALDFEKSMTKINTLVGVSAEEVEKLKKQVLDLSGKTATAPIELAEGLYFLTSAGLSSTDAMEALEQVSKGVASGLGESADLANVAAAAQNAYGKETMSASKALDIFGGMVKTGMFNASELSQVLGTQLGLAASLGISFEEVGAMISTYTKTTGDANAATTGLSGVMMSFAKITPKQADALDAVGLSAGSVRDMLSKKGLQGTLLEMQKRFAENNIPLSEFFSKSQSLKAVLGVLGNQTDTYIDILDELGNSVGFVDGAFEKTAETSAFKMNQALNSLRVSGTQLGNDLFPVVDLLAEKIKKLTNWFSSLDEDARKNIVTWGLVAAAIGPALMIIGQISIGIAALIPLVAKLNLTIAANPIAAMVVAIAALAGAFYWLITSSSDTATSIRNAFVFMANGIVNGINLIIKGLNKINPLKQIPLIKQFSYEGKKELEILEEGAKNAAKEIENLSKGLTKTGGGKTTNGGSGGSGGGGTTLSAIPMLGVKGLNVETKGMFEPVEFEYESTLKTMEEQTAFTVGVIVEDWQKGIDKVKTVLSSIGGVMSALNEKQSVEFDIWKEQQDEKAEILDNQLQKDIEAVENSTMSEERKRARIDELQVAAAAKKEALDKKVEVKEREMKRKQAVRDKAMGIVNAIISTSEAIMGAVAASPLTGGMPWSAIVAGLGAAEVATIASTPIPFAKGGLVTGPTLGLIGEGSGTSAFNPEVVSPLDKLMRMMGGNRVDVHGRIEGENIVLVSDKATLSRERFI